MPLSWKHLIWAIEKTCYTISDILVAFNIEEYHKTWHKWLKYIRIFQLDHNFVTYWSRGVVELVFQLINGVCGTLVLVGGGGVVGVVTKPIFRCCVISPIFQNNTQLVTYLWDITLIFINCWHNLVKVTPGKYEYDFRGTTYNSASTKSFLM